MLQFITMQYAIFPSLTLLCVFGSYWAKKASKCLFFDIKDLNEKTLEQERVKNIHKT